MLNHACTLIVTPRGGGGGGVGKEEWLHGEMAVCLWSEKSALLKGATTVWEEQVHSDIWRDFFSLDRLSYLSFDDLVFCAEQMLDHWTVGSVEGSTGQCLWKLLTKIFVNFNSFKWIKYQLIIYERGELCQH